MGKKNKNKKRKVSVQKTQNVQAVEQSQVVEQTQDKQEVKEKTVKAVKAKEQVKKPKKEKKGNSLFRRLKETGSELKKVSWPSFSNVLKKTGVVLVVVLFFSLILFGIDLGLSKLFEVLVP